MALRPLRPPTTSTYDYNKYTNRKLKEKSKGFFELLFSNKNKKGLREMCDERVLW
ncbi:MAG: hypothetical protein HQK49_08220 [Oligoflexia bacterium]|nr:hypothetical protein [Oligoflexia bacterium]